MPNDHAQQKNTNMTPDSSLPNLVAFSDIKNHHAIKGWEEYLREGRQYLNTATRAFAEGRPAFTPEILYNVIAMSIEKLVMGALMEQGKLPYNHTMHDLVEAMEEHLPDKILGLGRQLTALDAYQEICDIDSYSIKPPAMEEIPAMLSLATELLSRLFPPSQK